MPGLEDNGERPSASVPPPGEENENEEKSSGAEVGFDAWLIPEFDGSDDVVEWFTRAEVLCSHRGASLLSILPALVTSGALGRLPSGCSCPSRSGSRKRTFETRCTTCSAWIN